MVKLTPEQAKWVWLYLSRAREIDEQAFTRLVIRDDHEISRNLFMAYEEHGFEAIKETPQSLKRVLEQVLSSAFSETEEVSLIDKVISIVSSSYAQNVLSGKTLERLRKALFSAEEARNLDTKSVEAQQYCGNCGKEFACGELATSQISAGERVFQCARCAPPTRIACSDAGCSRSVSFSLKSLRRRCEDHSRSQEVSPASNGENPFTIYENIVFPNSYTGS